MSRVVHAVKGAPEPLNPLEMVWPETKLSTPPEVKIADGYRLRQFDPLETENYYDMFVAAGIGKPPLDYWHKHVLPGGFFVMEHIDSKAMVGSILAAHQPTSRHPCAGIMSWMAVDAKHRGKHIGASLSSAVTARLIAIGYQRMYLNIPDDRLTALHIHLKVGWVPFLYLPEMEARWAKVLDEINCPFEPEKCITV